MQPRSETVLELIIHVATGILITVGVMCMFFPEIPVLTNLKATLAITGIKFIANYIVRRHFTQRRFNREATKSRD